MPLNPPSYIGQDVWYSRNVFVNKVQVALWQPPQPMETAVSTPVPPLPTLNFTQDQLSMIQQTNSNYTYVDPDTNQNITMNYSDIPNPDAAPGQFAGPESSISAPMTFPPASGNAYVTMINNLTQILQEARGGAWLATVSNPNLRQMCRDLGANWGQPYGPRPAGGWCAMFVSWVLYKSGLPILVGGRTQRAVPRARDWANYGTRISPQDPRQWRKGDIVIVGAAATGGETLSGNHVGFLWGINTAANSIYLAGGNQGPNPGNVTQGSRERNFLTNTRSGSGVRAVAVVRGWALPSEYDRPLPGA